MVFAKEITLWSILGQQTSLGLEFGSWSCSKCIPGYKILSFSGYSLKLTPQLWNFKLPINILLGLKTEQKIGFVLAKKLGWRDVGGHNHDMLCTWRLSWLAVEKLWLALAGLFLSFLAYSIHSQQTSLGLEFGSFKFYSLKFTPQWWMLANLSGWRLNSCYSSRDHCTSFYCCIGIRGRLTLFNGHPQWGRSTVQQLPLQYFSNPWIAGNLLLHVTDTWAVCLHKVDTCWPLLPDCSSTLLDTVATFCLLSKERVWRTNCKPFFVAPVQVLEFWMFAKQTYCSLLKIKNVYEKCDWWPLPSLST